MGDKEQGFLKMGMNPATTTDPEHALKSTFHKQLPVYKRKKPRICCCVCLVVLISLAIVAVALSQTIFKFRDPEVSLNDIKLQRISVNFDLSSLATLLSISISTDVRVDNPNYYDFRYSNSTMLLNYHGDRVGVVELGAGTIRSRKTVELHAVVTVEAVRLVLNALQDISSGVASFNLDAVVSGRVNLAHVVKKHVTAVLDCDIQVFLANQTLKDVQCKRKIKL